MKINVKLGNKKWETALSYAASQTHLVQKRKLKVECKPQELENILSFLLQLLEANE